MTPVGRPGEVRSRKRHDFGVRNCWVRCPRCASAPIAFTRAGRSHEESRVVSFQLPSVGVLLGSSCSEFDEHEARALRITIGRGPGELITLGRGPAELITLGRGPGGVLGLPWGSWDCPRSGSGGPGLALRITLGRGPGELITLGRVLVLSLGRGPGVRDWRSELPSVGVLRGSRAGVRDWPSELPSVGVLHGSCTG